VPAAREEILAALAARPATRVEHPGSVGPWQSFPDRVATFCERLEAAAGQCVPIAAEALLAEAVTDIANARSAKRVRSLVAAVPSTGEPVREPHDVAGVGLAVLEAELGVAENGAVWVSDTGFAPRSIFSLAEHLAVVLRAGAIVDQMHDAYARLAFDRPGFGCFLSGPSKTADIEQALVIGAHGARTLTVLLVGDA
jgi:L-lactate dehydrogenase complex protein LldG